MLDACGVLVNAEPMNDAHARRQATMRSHGRHGAASAADQDYERRIRQPTTAFARNSERERGCVGLHAVETNSIDGDRLHREPDEADARSAARRTRDGQRNLHRAHEHERVY